MTDELNDVLKQATFAEKIRADELTSLLKENIKKVVQHGKRANSIIKNMLLHSREGSGERRSADINALVGESLNLAYHGARAEKAGFTITLKQDLAPNAGSIELYPQEITRALLNLISNGFYAATRRKVKADDESSFEPLLSAATRDLGKAVEIRIRDNGTGIPPEVREKMFNPFFTTKPTGEGTGLGLSITHDIVVKQRGGRIDVETEPGEFTRIHHHPAARKFVRLEAGMTVVCPFATCGQSRMSGLRRRKPTSALGAFASFRPCADDFRCTSINRQFVELLRRATAGDLWQGDREAPALSTVKTPISTTLRSSGQATEWVLRGIARFPRRRCSIVVC